jgi:hypothetical protein
MPLIGGRVIPLALKHMPQMAPAIRAHDLRALHAEGAIGMACYRSGDIIKVCWPTAAGLELVVRGVQRGVAAGAGVDTSLWCVLVKFASVRGFGPLLSEDSELVCSRVRTDRMSGGYLEYKPLESTARHSSSVFWTG